MAVYDRLVANEPVASVDSRQSNSSSWRDRIDGEDMFVLETLTKDICAGRA